MCVGARAGGTLVDTKGNFEPIDNGGSPLSSGWPGIFILPKSASHKRKRTQWALTRGEMKNCVWVKPELVVQIEFGEWTPDGHLRHSRFVTLRDDKNPHEVIRES